MKDRDGDPLFDVAVSRNRDEEQGAEVRLGIRCVIRGEPAVCPISPPCFTIEALRSEAEKVRLELDRVLERGEAVLAGTREPGTSDLAGDMTAEELWRVLEAIPDDDLFIERFNELEDVQRKEVAEHVLTSCSVFSGRPALFSSRYDAETALLGD